MKKKANILYITFDGICDSLGRSQVLPYLVGLSKEYNITILSAEKPKVLQEHNNLVQSIVNKNSIKWVYTEYFNKPPIIGPYLLKRKITQIANQLQQTDNYDVIHCRSYLSAMVGLYLKRKYRVKFIFDMRGFWADERVDGKIWDRKKPIYNFIYSYFKKQEKVLLQSADYIVTLTHSAKEIIHGWKYINGENLKIQVVPCCVDLDKFNQDKIDLQKAIDYKNELKISDSDFILSYLGSIGTWYMLNEMLDFFKELLLEKPAAKFLFISKEKASVIRACKEKNIDLDKIIIKPVAYDDVPTLLRLSDASIFFILPVFSKKASSPVKQGEIMAMGIPIICNSGVGDTDFVIEKYNAGILVDEFTNIDYSQSIKKFENTQFNKEEIKRGADEYYALEKGVEKYNNIYKSIVE